MDRKTRILVTLPIAFTIILAVVAYYIPFGRILSDSEAEILNFLPSEFKIRTKRIKYTYKNADAPFDFSRPVNNEQMSSREVQHEKKDGLSLVVISGSKKMAIIHGKLVKEGDDVNGMKVAKIETDRVLLGGKTMKWLYLERAK